MEVRKIFKADYLDLLFEGRNKNYGSYALRKEYPQRLRNAGFFVMGMLGVLSGGAFMAKAGKPVADRQVVVTISPVLPVLPPPARPKTLPPQAPPAPPRSARPAVKFTPPIIEKDKNVKTDEMPPDTKHLEKSIPALKNEKGIPGDIEPGIAGKPGTGVTEAPAPPQIFRYVEQMPEFPGNVNEYLSRNIRYPEAAREQGIEGRVTIQFIVGEDGTISDVKVVGTEHHGGGLEEEAVRVVRSMPAWQPGKQNGKTVKVYYMLPVWFRLG